MIITLLVSCGADQSEVTELASLDSLFDNYFRKVIKLDPEAATRIGLTNSSGYDFDEAALTDESESAQLNIARIAQAYLDSLHYLDFTQLNQTDYINARCFEFYLQTIVDENQYRSLQYLCDHLFGIHPNLLHLLTENHKINTRQDADNYLSRLSCFAERFRIHLENLDIRKKKGVIPPVVILDRYLEILDNFIQLPIEKNYYYTYFIEAVKQLDLSDAEKSLLAESAANLMDSQVYPEYRKLIAYLNELKKEAGTKTGLWQYPGGNDYYSFCLFKHTTTEISPETVHQLGLKEVARIQGEITLILQELGIETGGGFNETMSNYWSALEDSLLVNNTYPRTEIGRAQALQDYRKILNQTRERLPELFSWIPQTEVTVKRVPLPKEGFFGQFYQPAPIDGSAPAVFYTNLNWPPFKPGMQTLLYHETIPGHHLQFAAAQESGQNIMFRNLTFFTGYIEGWALYAEKIAYESNWFEDVFSRIGYLSSELFRAVRLVIDTGMHYKKWRREKAYEYMVNNLGWGSYSEIDRYLVWPGQACAYKIGELKILELREKVQTALGERYDIKEFHRIILENGSVPLALLEEIVNNYIKEKKR